MLDNLKITKLGHSFDTSWAYDNTNHRHECSCGLKADETAHVEEVINALEATSSKKGYTGDKVCSICGYLIEKGEEIPMKTNAIKTTTETNKTHTSNFNVKTGAMNNFTLWFGLMTFACVGTSNIVLYDKKKI